MTGKDYDWLLPSHHCSIHFTTTLAKPRYERVVHSSGKTHPTNINVWVSMIESVLLHMAPLECDVSRLVEEYNDMMKAVIGKVAPLVASCTQ